MTGTRSSTKQILDRNSTVGLVGQTKMAANVFELVCYNRHRQTRLVLEAGGDSNFRNEIGETPLMACAMFIRDQDRRTQLMRMLIGFGAEVNAQNDKGQTLLMYACILDQGDTILLLLDTVDVDLNLYDVSGNTCLMYACALDRSALVYVLLDGYQSGRFSVNVYHRNHEGFTAREIAEQRNLVHITELFADTVDKDYWSSYGELSRELDSSKHKTYPLKIDGDPSEPLASMVERILHIRQEQTTAADHETKVVTSRQDSASGSRIKTRTNGDLGSASHCVDRAESQPTKQGISLEDGSSRPEGKGRTMFRKDSLRRRKSSRTRQSSRDNSVSCFEGAQSGPSTKKDIPDPSLEPSINEVDAIRYSPENSSTVLNIMIDPESARYVRGINSARTESQRVNYYARHDIQDHLVDNTLSATEAQGVFPHTPRPPTRSKSRARRRKTTEVYVTVSDGKIVPYNGTKQHGGTRDNYGAKDNNILYTGSESEPPHYKTQAVRSPSTMTFSDRSPSRSRQRRVRKLDRVSLPRSSINTEPGESNARSSSRPTVQDHYQNGDCNNVAREHTRMCGFNPRNSENYDMTYDSIKGAPDFNSVLKTHTSYISHVPIHKDNGNTLRKSDSFRNTSRENGSHRAVAW